MASSIDSTLSTSPNGASQEMVSNDGSFSFAKVSYLPISSQSEYGVGRSQTTFTTMGGEGVRQMSMLLNKYGKFY